MENNVWEPSAYPQGWKTIDISGGVIPQPEEPEKPTPEPEEPKYPDFIQPTGAHDAYHIGDRVIYNGKLYECILDGNAYSPDDYPQGWKEITDENI